MINLFDASEVNVRSLRYLIASTRGHCGRCGEETRLVALCLPPGHEVFELDEDAPDEVNDGFWSSFPRHVLLFHVNYLPDAVLRRLHQATPSYDFDPSDEVSCWANHCEHCGRAQDDNELFCEPEGAFLPASAAGARLIRLVAVDEPLEAGAAGFAYEPEYFDAMVRG